MRYFTLLVNLLRLCFHASVCGTAAERLTVQYHCRIIYCGSIKDALAHMVNCHRDTDCPERLCGVVKRICHHWNNCRDSNCGLCADIKNREAALLSTSTTEPRAKRCRGNRKQRMGTTAVRKCPLILQKLPLDVLESIYDLGNATSLAKYARSCTLREPLQTDEWIRNTLEAWCTRPMGADIRDLPCRFEELFSLAVSGQDANGLVCVTHNRRVFSRDLDSLDLQRFLSDGLISAYVSVLSKSRIVHSPRFQILDPSFCGFVANEHLDFHDMSPGYREVDFALTDIVVLPARLGKAITAYQIDYCIQPFRHWVCIAVFPRKCQILVFIPKDGFYNEFVVPLMARLLDYLSYRYHSDGWYDPTMWKWGYARCPQLQEERDSGLFAITVAKYLILGRRLDFTQQHVGRLKKTIGFEVVTGKILDEYVYKCVKTFCVFSSCSHPRGQFSPGRVFFNPP